MFNKLAVMIKRTNHSAGFKTKVELEALKEREAIKQNEMKYDLHQDQMSTWKTKLLADASKCLRKDLYRLIS